jgi:hypothetical protein
MIYSDSNYFLLELKLSLIKDANLEVFAKAKYKNIFLSEFKNKVLFMNDRRINLNKDAFIVGNNCIATFINNIIDINQSKKVKQLIKLPNFVYNVFIKNHITNYL